MIPWCERVTHGGRNSGRAVATIMSGADAPRSASIFKRSSEVGSAQWRSSKASTSGCARAPASNQAAIAASWRRRSSSGGSASAPNRCGGNVEERREQGRKFDRIELHLRQRGFEVVKPPLRRNFD